MGLMFQNGTVGTTGPEMWLGASAFEARGGVWVASGGPGLHLQSFEEEYTACGPCPSTIRGSVLTFCHLDCRRHASACWGLLFVFGYSGERHPSRDYFSY